MISASRDHDRSLGHFLTAHVTKIFVVFRKLLKQLANPRGSRLDGQSAGEKSDSFSEAGNGNRFDLFDNRRFGRALSRNHNALQPALDNSLLEDLVDLLGTLRRACLAGRTDEDVMAILTH